MLTPALGLFAVAAALVAASVAFTVVFDRDRPDPPPPAAGGAPSVDTVEAAFAPLLDPASRLPDRARSWMSGELTDRRFGRYVDDAEEAFSTAREQVTALVAARPDERSLPVYEDSALLYVEHARVYRAALGLTGEERVQADLLARRVRLLADRVFDRARVLAGVEAVADPNAVINLPEEVPNWEVEGLAAGPPLDEAPDDASRPALREEHRPVQPREAWVAAVESAGAPRPGALRASLDGDDHDALGTIARAFVAAAERLRATPDAEGDREGSARARLALLVGGEAARAAQLAALGSVQRSERELLEGVARRLALISDRLWRSTGLSPRVTGFPTAELYGGG